MNDSISKYLNVSKNNLYTILLNLENNIEFTANDLWNDNSEFELMLKKILDIYFDKYYLYDSFDFKIIDKYIKFNSKINIKLKSILLAIIEYYTSKSMENVFNEKENSILYLTILIYIALIIYDSNFESIDNPKKIEKVINNIIDNFQNIRFRREKDLIKMIDNIKDIIIKNNNFIKNINDLNNKNIHNSFIKINNNTNLYKAVFEYNIKELDNYEYIDIGIVNEKMNIMNVFNNISFDLLYYTSFKLLKNGICKVLLFDTKKEYFVDEKNRNYILGRNKTVLKNIKILFDYNDIKNDYDFINLMKESGFDIYIIVNENVETNNYNMFMGISNIIVDEEFLSINEKYIEIWKDMNINFIVKNLNSKISEDMLCKGK